MKKKSSIFTLVVCIMLGAAVGTTEAEVDRDRTLAPYFAIDHGDPGIDRFPLKRTHADVVITGVISRVFVTQTYVNDGTRPINAKYVFPASTRASVHGMKLIIGDHVISAKIKERKKAKQAFKVAKRSGKSASLLQQHRPNVFSVDVANIMPGDTIDVELQYSELLVPTDGTYEFVFPTVVGPRYSEFTEKSATDADRWLQNPYLTEGKESPSEFAISTRIMAGMPLKEFACLSHEVDIAWQSDESATVRLKPAEVHGGNRDFILQYRLSGEQIDSGLMLYEGEGEKFFLLMAEPPARIRTSDIPAREYVFIVDVSGSMNGFPLQVSKQLLRSLIGNLRPIDTFNILLFAGRSDFMSPVSLPASEANIKKAIEVIDRQRGGGGTRLLAAMQRAYAMEAGAAGISRNFLVITDGYISAERDVFMLIRKNLNSANVFAFGIGSSVNRHLIEGVAKAGRGEPFIVTEPGMAKSQSKKFSQYIASPVLTDISVSYDGFDAYDIEPGSIPDLLAQRPLLIFGKWRGPARGSITVKGMTGSGDYSRSFNVAGTTSTAKNKPLRYLWARTRVAELSDNNFSDQNQETIDAITSLGLTYDLLTRYTSFVAVHEQIRNPGKISQDIKQPLPLPKGVSNLAIGSPPSVSAISARKVPEPELLILFLSISSYVAILLLLRRLRAAGEKK